MNLSNSLLDCVFARGDAPAPVRSVVLLVVLSAAASWATDAAASDYVGAESCGSCHEAQYRQWLSSGHALALARLSKTQRRDRGCRSCHTMDPMSDDPGLAGVQCESCHGSGRFYAPRYVMKDEILAELLGLQKVEASTCARCHKADGPGVVPFDYHQKVELVRHGAKTKPAAARNPHR